MSGFNFMAAMDTYLQAQFGLEVVFTPRGGSPQTLTGNRGPESSENQEGEYHEDAEIRCQFTLYGSALARPAAGDLVHAVAADETWEVERILEFIPGRLARVACRQVYFEKTGGVIRRRR